jgi:transcription initiation factor TFIID subunit TAF12
VRGKKTDAKLIDEIAKLLKLHRPADVVSMMAGRLPRRTVYRIIAKLKAEDQRRKFEEAQQFRQSMERRTMSHLEFLQSRKRYKKVSDFPPNLRRVRSF